MNRVYFLHKSSLTMLYYILMVPCLVKCIPSRGFLKSGVAKVILTEPVFEPPILVNRKYLFTYNNIGMSSASLN